MLFLVKSFLYKEFIARFKTFYRVCITKVLLNKCVFYSGFLTGFYDKRGIPA